MADETVERVTGKGGGWLTLDVWAVLLAFVAAVLVKIGVLQNISW